MQGGKAPRVPSHNCPLILSHNLSEADASRFEFEPDGDREFKVLPISRRIFTQTSRFSNLDSEDRKSRLANRYSLFVE